MSGQKRQFVQTSIYDFLGQEEPDKKRKKRQLINNGFKALSLLHGSERAIYDAIKQSKLTRLDVLEIQEVTRIEVDEVRSILLRLQEMKLVHNVPNVWGGEMWTVS